MLRGLAGEFGEAAVAETDRQVVIRGNLTRRPGWLQYRQQLLFRIPLSRASFCLRSVMSM